MTTTSDLTSVMNVLTQAALAQSTSLTQYRFQLIQQQLTKQYQQKIAAASQGTDTASQNFLKAQIAALSTQRALFGTLRAQYGANANILTDLQKQLVTAQTAAQAGDSATFDGAVAAAQTDIGNLIVAPQNPNLQPDGVAQLKTNGIAVHSSATYGLSTASGRSAALADLAAAQNKIAQIFVTTTGNQNVAGSQATALDGQVSLLTNQLQQQQLDQAAKLTTAVTKLRQQLATQVHLIELNLSNSSAAGASLQQQELQGQSAFGPPTPGTIFTLFA